MRICWNLDKVADIPRNDTAAGAEPEFNISFTTISDNMEPLISVIQGQWPGPTRVWHG